MTTRYPMVKGGILTRRDHVGGIMELPLPKNGIRPDLKRVF
jgi:hypothetical protein